MRQYYNKLVRDKIPEIIKAAGIDCNIQVLSETVYRKALKKKLLEEAQEVALANSEELLEELADLYEVIEAILLTYHISKDTLLAEQEKRQKERGGFEQKIQLNWTIKTEKRSPSLNFAMETPVKKYLEQVGAKQAQILDQDWQSLQKALLELGKLNLLALRVPKHLGGRQWDDLTFYQWQMLISRSSGALAFLQTQHQSAASQISASSNEQLKERYLPYMGNGEILVGVGLSQLRRQGKSDLVAQAVPGGYLLEGKIPWITGYQIFSEFIVGASLADGRAIYGLIPFTPVTGQIFLTQPHLLAVPSTNTVEAQIVQWFLREEQVIAIKEPNSLQINDQKNVLHHGYMALGCARAGLDILETIAKQKSLSFIEKTREILLHEWTELKDFMFSHEETSYQKRLEYRVDAINLAGRCAQGAIIATSGSANIQDNPASRIYREALLFTVSGQTLDVMQGSLEMLTK